MIPGIIEGVLLALVAFVIGGFIGQKLRPLVPARRQAVGLEPAPVEAPIPAAQPATAEPAEIVATPTPPPDPLVEAAQPSHQAHDLAALGVTAGDAAKLRSVGITEPAQLSQWGEGHIAWVARYLSRPIEDVQRWTQQAKLHAGA